LMEFSLKSIDQEGGKAFKGTGGNMSFAPPDGVTIFAQAPKNRTVRYNKYFL